MGYRRKVHVFYHHFSLVLSCFNSALSQFLPVLMAPTEAHCLNECICNQLCFPQKNFTAYNVSGMPAYQYNIELGTTGEFVSIGIVNETVFGAVNVANLDSQTPGYWVEIANLACKIANFTCEFIVWPDNNYGQKDINGNWTGFMGAIANGTFHTSIPMINPTSARMVDFNFGTMSPVAPYYFAVRKWDKIYSFLSVVEPLKGPVWLVIGFTLVVVALVMTLIHFPIGKHWTEVKMKRISKYFTHVLLSLAVNLARKNFPLSNRKLPGKILLSVWGFGSLIMISFYSTGLLRSMLTKDNQPPFANIIQLATCINDNRCSMVNTAAGDWFLQELHEAQPESEMFPLHLALQKRPPLQVSTTEEALRLVESSHDLILVTWPDQAEMFAGDSHVSYNLTLIPLGMSIPSNFVFQKSQVEIKKKIDAAMMEMFRTGLIPRLIAKYPLKPSVDIWSPNPRERLYVKPLPIDALIGTVILLAIGFALASLSLAIEKIL